MGKEEGKSEEINKVCGPVWVKIIVSTNRNMIMGNHLARRMVKIKHVADIKHQNVKTQNTSMYVPVLTCYWESTRLSTQLLITYQLIIDDLITGLKTCPLVIEFLNYNNLPGWLEFHPDRLSNLKPYTCLW
jgi:hypothetical protein